MSKKTRRILSGVFVIFLIVLGNFLLSLLTNYASENVPTMFQKSPWLLWALIMLTIAAIAFVNFYEEFRKSDNTGVEMPGEQKTDQSALEPIFDDIPVMYDAFISYSHKDKQFVNEMLIPFLKQRSFTYCVDSESFRTGSTSVEEIERCVNSSKRIILVLTKAYLQSEWANFENVMAQTLDPSAKNRKLIPILLEDCDLPSRFKMLHYRDLRTNQSSQWDLLARDLA